MWHHSKSEISQKGVITEGRRDEGRLGDLVQGRTIEFRKKWCELESMGAHGLTRE